MQSVHKYALVINKVKNNYYTTNKNQEYLLTIGFIKIKSNMTNFKSKHLDLMTGDKQNCCQYRKINMNQFMTNLVTFFCFKYQLQTVEVRNQEVKYFQNINIFTVVYI